MGRGLMTLCFTWWCHTRGRVSLFVFFRHCGLEKGPDAFAFAYIAYNLEQRFGFESLMSGDGTQEEKGCVSGSATVQKSELPDVPLGQDSMGERFDCAGCKQSLYGRKFIQTEDSPPHCISCYNKLLTHTCAECKELIEHNARELSYENQHYHEHCFRCFRCERSLADERFTCQGKALLCNECFCNEFSSKCVACDKTIQPGSRKLEYRGSTWHETCFVCLNCEQPIGSKAFVPDQDGHYCSPCYENKFSPRCSHCKEVLVSGGVTYRDEAWHRHCFVCTGCKVELAGKQFTSEEDSPYCVQCFSKLYARKCVNCSEPITGFGEGKFVSFGERHWHQTCFSCSLCSASLVGVGFFPEEDQILCRDCSTQS